MRVAVAATVTWIAYDGGSYNVSSWTSLGIVTWWTVAVGLALGVWRRRSIGPAAAVVAGAFTLFAFYSGLSALWASGAGQPIEAMGRVLLYVGVLVLAYAAGTPRSLGRWCDGIAAGLSAIAVLAVLSRLFHGSFGDDAALRFLPDATTRLSYPVAYWNGLAVLVALACPLLLRAATVSHRRLGALALAPIPVIAATIYLASSRSGAVTAAVGICAFAALAGRRRIAVLAAAVAVLATVAAVVVVSTQHALVNGPLDSAAAASDGRRMTLALVLLAAATSALHAILVPRVERLRIDRRLVRAAAVVAVVLVAVAVASGHPVARWHS
ncbi:MAG: hypothetical protein QOH95_2832, partial [Gaiellaceae bacterium]|nr:hypothetical protein [Gaiellaceae bacterium]